MCVCMDACMHAGMHSCLHACMYGQSQLGSPHVSRCAAHVWGLALLLHAALGYEAHTTDTVSSARPTSLAFSSESCSWIHLSFTISSRFCTPQVSAFALLY
jgi:hypothetical protein